MKPFNLEQALAGKKVVNGRGDEVAITKLAITSPDKMSLISQRAESGDLLAYHYLDGRSDGGRLSDYTLYMALEKKEAWVNLYNVAACNEGLGKGEVFTSEELADMWCLSEERLGGKAFRITYEE